MAALTSNHPFEHWRDFRTAKRSQAVEEQPKGHRLWRNSQTITGCGGTAKRSQAVEEQPNGHRLWSNSQTVTGCGATAKRSQAVEEQPNGHRLWSNSQTVTGCGATAKRSQAAKNQPKASLTLQTGARQVDGATACHQMERHLVLVREVCVHLKLLNQNRKWVSFVYF